MLQGSNLTLRCYTAMNNKPGRGKLGYNWTRNKALFPMVPGKEFWEDLYPDGSILKLRDIQVSESFQHFISVLESWIDVELSAVAFSILQALTANFASSTRNQLSFNAPTPLKGDLDPVFRVPQVRGITYPQVYPRLSCLVLYARGKGSKMINAPPLETRPQGFNQLERRSEQGECSPCIIMSKDPSTRPLLTRNHEASTNRSHRGRVKGWRMWWIAERGKGHWNGSSFPIDYRFFVESRKRWTRPIYNRKHTTSWQAQPEKIVQPAPGLVNTSRSWRISRKRNNFLWTFPEK